MGTRTRVHHGLSPRFVGGHHRCGMVYAPARVACRRVRPRLLLARMLCRIFPCPTHDQRQKRNHRTQNVQTHLRVSQKISAYFVPQIPQTGAEKKNKICGTVLRSAPCSTSLRRDLRENLGICFFVPQNPQTGAEKEKQNLRNSTRSAGKPWRMFFVPQNPQRGAEKKKQNLRNSARSAGKPKCT